MRIRNLTWTDATGPAELQSSVALEGSDYLVIPKPRFRSLDRLVQSLQAPMPAEIVIAYDPDVRSRWARLRRLLPPQILCLIALPEHDSGIAIASRTLRSQSGIVNQSATIGELVVRLAESASVSYVETDPDTSLPRIADPALTIPPGASHVPWLREIIQRLQFPGSRVSPTGLTAFKAGSLLLNDFFDESHICSQSIEGLGSDRTGDYWHAILHRREPDYGNAKYWFRHVGRHPAYGDLAPVAKSHLTSATGSVAVKLHRWKEHLLSRNWDPSAFVDLCEAAENDSELKTWCEQLQHLEMLILLEHSLKSDE